MESPEQQWWWPGEGRQEVAQGRERRPKVYGEAWTNCHPHPPNGWFGVPHGVRPELQPPDPRLKDPGFWKPSPSINSLWTKLWEPSTRPSGGPSTALTDALEPTVLRARVPTGHYIATRTSGQMDKE